MALVRIDSSRPHPPEELQRWARTVNGAMHTLLGVPPRENHVICAAHETGRVLHDPDGTAPDELAETVFIQITLNQGRPAELKARFMDQLALDLAQACGANPERVYVNLIEVAPQNWRFSAPR
jgi:4-oxalocrotonate tautomerase